MSRLVVKNLPKKITEDKIRETFSEKGIVTDVQLKYTKDGKFRQFAFIGFKSPEDATRALNYFNNTFINSAKMKIELCADLGDPNKPKAWSKYATDSSAYIKKHGETNSVPVIPVEPEIKKQKGKKGKKELDPKIQELIEKHKDDPLFAEFMESHARGNKAVWNNDTINEALGISKDTKIDDEVVLEDETIPKADKKVATDENESDNHSDGSVSEEEDNIAKKKISDLDYLKSKTVEKVKNEEDESSDVKTQASSGKPERVKMPKQEKTHLELFTVKIRGLTYKEKKKDLKLFFHPLKPKSFRLPRNIKGIAYVGFTTEKDMKQALIKNKSFLGGNRLWVTKYEKHEEKPEAESEKTNSHWRSQQDNLKNEETIAESGRIFVRNLSYLITEDDLEKLFNAYGPTTEVSMPVDRLTRKPKGLAHITYVFPEHATKAYSELDGTVFHGRMLHLLPGIAKASLQEAMEQDGLSFSEKKTLKLKSQSGSSHNWNSLFLGQNAVADVMAATYNTTKDQVLDARGKESIAVRLALGETQIVAQTKDFLTQSGVQLNAFNLAPKQRSKTIILVKNLPANTTTIEIRELFQPHGELGRVVLPPSGITAIVEYVEPSEARKAFTRLAYTKFKNLPLYLEWAPFDTFGLPATKPEGSTLKSGEAPDASTGEGVKCEAVKQDEVQDEVDDEPPEPDTMLYLKNLNFNTTEGEIKKYFIRCGPIHSVSVATKNDLKNPGQLLSMGYGFLQFKKKASTETALKTMQMSMLDGHVIELKRSHRTLQTEVKTARKVTEVGKQTGTKILVRNIPFQATQHEITDIFKAFGELKAVRLPKKMTGTGSHRGFAFIEFETKHDSHRAFEALSQSTHLYGRRLVLEWALKEDNVDDLRKRTADHFFTGPSNIKTLRKATVEPEELEEEL